MTGQIKGDIRQLAGPKLFCDGGVIGSSRGPGGAWAWRLDTGDPAKPTIDRSGAILPGNTFYKPESEHPWQEDVTSPQAEMIAAMQALEYVEGLTHTEGFMGEKWTGAFLTDCKNVLGWLYWGYKTENLYWHVRERLEAMHRYDFLPGLSYVLLDGHPSQAQLDAGFGKRGQPVHEHNRWCDRECNRVKKLIESGDLKGIDVTYV